ncbi:otu-like cysteine protease [Cystoisospora suis]|uniref:Otu-like cysteine protease n=1 Tax=Cystoisospora suis TaxID=483139 RepID=A0A2C6LAR8_9APIC|nr:otu-like cysteine protease [Cystoisospora suis]
MGVSTTAAADYQFRQATAEQRRWALHNLFPHWDGREETQAEAQAHAASPPSAEVQAARPLLTFNEDRFTSHHEPALYLSQPTAYGDRTAVPGDCLFASISYALTGSPSNSWLIRQQIASHIERHPDIVSNAAVAEVAGPVRPGETRDQWVRRYTQGLLRLSTWGDDLHIQLLCDLARVNVFLYRQGPGKQPAGGGSPLEAWTLYSTKDGPGDYPVIFLLHEPGHYKSVTRVRSY